MFLCRHAQIWLRINRCNAHDTHQALHPLAVHNVFSLLERLGDFATAI